MALPVLKVRLWLAAQTRQEWRPIMPTTMVPHFPLLENQGINPLERSGKSWPSRRDPDFTNPNPAAVQVGDTIHSWTVIDKVTEYRTDFSECHDIAVAGGLGYPRYCVPVIDYHTPTCHEVEYAVITYDLVCDCGSIKTTNDPFASRRCLHHGTNLYEFEKFCRQLVCLAV